MRKTNLCDWCIAKKIFQCIALSLAIWVAATLAFCNPLRSSPPSVKLRLVAFDYLFGRLCFGNGFPMEVPFLIRSPDT